MRLGVRPLVRWFRLNIDRDGMNPSGNGGGATTGNNKPSTVRTPTTSEQSTSDLLHDLTACFSSSLAKSNVVPPPSSRSRKSLVNTVVRTFQPSTPTGLLSHGELVLDIVKGLKDEESIGEALQGREMEFVVTDELVAKVVLGAEDVETACLFFKWSCTSGGRYRPGVLACDCMVQVLIKAGRVDEAYGMFRRVAELYDVFSNFTCSILVQALASQGNVERAVMVFEEMKSRADVNQESIVNCLAFLIRGFCKGGRVREAFHQYRKLKTDLRMDVVVYNTLIDGLLKSKLVSDALEVFEDMEKEFCQPNVHTYSALVSGFCKGGRVDEACKMFEQMISTGYSPNVVLYTTLIDALCKTRQFDKACSYMDRMDKPDIVTYSSLIDGLCVIGRIEYAQELLEQITERGNVKPDVVLYNIFVKGLCKAGQLNNALGLFRKMSDKGCPPNTATYNTVMRGLAWHDRVEDARKLFKEMITQGCQPDGGTYMIISEVFLSRSNLDEARKLIEEVNEECKSSAINVSRIGELCKAGNVDEAYRMYQTMADAVQINAGVYASLISGFLQEGKYLEVDKLVREMLSRGCSPTYEIQKAFRVGVRRLLGKKRLEKLVHSMVSEMQEKHWLPNGLVCNSLVQCLCEAGYLDEAYQLVREADRNDKSLISKRLWDTLLQMVFASGKAGAKSLAVIKETVDRGDELHPLTHFAIIRGFLKAGLVNKAVKQLRLLVSSSRHCTKQMAMIHSKVHRTLCRRNRWEEAYELHQELVRRGLLPTRKSYNILIERQCSCGRLEVAEQLRRQMEQLGVLPSRLTHNLFVYGYCEAGMLKEAREAMHEIIGSGIRPARKSCRKLVEKLCESGCMAEAHELLVKMVQLGKPFPHLLTFNAVFQAYYAAGEFENARKLFRDMLRIFDLSMRRPDFPISVEQLRKIFE